MIELFGSWDAYYYQVPTRIVEEQKLVWLAERRAEAKLNEQKQQANNANPAQEAMSSRDEDEDEKLATLYKQLTGAN